MKKSIIIIIIILTLPIVIGLEECKYQQDPSLIPCIITSTWNYTKPCSNHNISIYDINGNNIQNQTFSNYTNTQLCKINWNISEMGSYHFLIDTGDTGSIIIKSEENKMIAIIISLTVLIIYFVAMGIINKSPLLRFGAFGLSLIELIYMVGIIYVNESSGILINLLRINFYIMGILGLGIGIISIFSLTVRMIDPSDELDDKKWSGTSKW